MRAATVEEAREQVAAEPGERLLVGWDGSRPSTAAVRWALDRAEWTGAPVTVLHVAQVGAGASSDAVLARVVEDAALTHPALNVTTLTVLGAVAPSLAEVADRSGDLLVVGTHKTGYVQGRVQGSRSAQIAASMRSRLVVVPDVDLRFRRGVVVGVQDHAEAVRLGAVAGFEADRCGGEVLVIHTVGAVRGGRTDELRREGALLLEDARAAAGSKGRVIRSRLVERDPLDGLLDASRTAALLVIGSSASTRGLGSTVHDVLLNVNAPTLLVPTPAGVGDAD